MIYIICPNDTYKYFKHIIIALNFELNNEDLQSKVILTHSFDEINMIKDSVLIFFGFQRFALNSTSAEGAIDPSGSFVKMLMDNKSILYNFEQLQSGNWNYLLPFTKYLYQWWDYSNINIAYLKSHCENAVVRHIPFGYSKSLELATTVAQSSNVITLFGTFHQRRHNLCNHLRQYISIPIVEFYNNQLFDKDYDDYIVKNKLYLNIHYYIPSILEIVRIVPLLSQGCLVISERSDDKELDEMFSPFILWLDEVLINRDEVIHERLSTNSFTKFKELSFYKFLTKANVFDSLRSLKEA